MVITHSCGARWTRAGACHCAGCHETFSSLSGFERHRRRGVCLDPAVCGLVRKSAGKAGGFMWTLPGTWKPESEL